MSLKEEVKEVKRIVLDVLPHYETKAINEITEKIIKLAPFSKLERVREYCEAQILILENRIKHYKSLKSKISYQISIEGAESEKKHCEIILSIISQNEKEFDVREWLESNEKLFQRDNTSATWESRTITDGESYVFELGATYLQINKIVWSIPGKRIEQRVYLYKGSIPTSLYFWEMLLKSLGIEL